jgi:hypothetical protein
VDPPEQDPADSLARSGLRTQGLAQVGAATAQVQRRKWTLMGKIVVWDYIGNQAMDRPTRQYPGFGT